ncbi:hypothetical protein ACIBO2_37265 [Nonomuraea sp. NPDC050022]|uniref:hypothetical protein n=1 Tax=unclassified Nonomuraea TaxID=2593643 RepID=UPI0033E68DA9
MCNISCALDGTDRRLPGLIKGVPFIEVEGGPHNIGRTFPEEVDRALLDFI